MKQEVKLYIANQLVDFSDTISLPFNFEFENLSNPTVVKNTFTKKITIIGTPNNNKIFGGIYNLDREQIYDTDKLINAYFNPSIRTPFQLFRNGDIIEDGYMQLNNIVLRDNLINYDITLYGGLGDFFYTLSYNEENEPLKLSDIDYGQDLSFILNKKTIKNSWTKLNGDGNITPSVEDYITFIPTYNGLYNEFDNNKVLINTNNSTLFPNKTEIIDGTPYTSRYGYYLAELNKDYTEWEMKSLMSFKQRPALKFSKFLEAVSNPKNNNGYEIVLDNSFFNNENPYYNNAYIALPLLETKFDTKLEVLEDNIKLGSNKFVGNNNGGIVASAIMPIVTLNNTEIVTNENGIISTGGMDNATTFSIDLDFQIFFQSNTPTTSTLYPSTINYFETSGKDGQILNVRSTLNSFLVYVNAVNYETKEIVGQSNLYNFTNNISLPFLNKDIYSKPSDWGLFFDDMPYTNVFGAYYYDSNLNKHYFKDDNGNNTFKIKIEDCKKIDNIAFQVFIYTVSNGNVPDQKMYPSDNYNIYEVPSTEGVTGKFNIQEDTTVSKMTIETGEVLIGSGQLVEQDILLKTDNTPLDYLLGYCKLFNLKFSSEIGEKKIYITKKNNYFNGNIINIDDKIDYSKDVIINPILYDKKFYKLALKSSDNYISKQYNNGYGVDYGQKRINTNYNFNSDTNDLLENNVYQNAISIVDTSIYYRTFLDSESNQLPPFYLDDFKLKKYNIGISTINEYDKEIKGNEHIKTIVDWNTNSGYDYTDKLCCFDKDGDNKSLADITSTLVFFDGMYTPKDNDGNTIQYWVTDDTSQMFIMNGKQCHLYTEDEYDVNKNWIAWKTPYLPKFSRYIIKNGMVINSWDFGKPKEIYIPNLTYNDDVTLYNQYWDRYYKDKLNINTKLVTANVNLSTFNVNEDMFKNFYYFKNSYWLLNKIDNYDINSNRTTKCEFIKINDKNNYLLDDNKYFNYFFIYDDSVIVNHSAGTFTTSVSATTKWKVVSYTSNKITSITPSTGEDGTTKITIKYKSNDNLYKDDEFGATFVDDNGKEFTINFKQTPNLDNVIISTGRINLISGTNTISASYNGNVTTVPIDENGEYQIYLPKNQNVSLSVRNNGKIIWNTTTKFNRNTILNITV